MPGLAAHVTAPGGPSAAEVACTLSQLWPESALQPLPPPDFGPLLAVSLPEDITYVRHVVAPA